MTASGSAVPFEGSAEIEQALLGSMLASREAIDFALDSDLRAEDFRQAGMGTVYDILVTLHQSDHSSQPIDIATLMTAIRASKAEQALTSLGGRTGLAKMLTAGGAPGRVPHLARLVQDHARTARLQAAALEIGELARNGGGGDESIEQAYLLLDKLRRDEDLSSVLYDVRGMYSEYLEYLDSLQQGAELFVRTGFSDLDEQLGGGLAPSSLTIVGARPSMGKSGFAISLANAAAKAKVPVLFFSLEMNERDVFMRLVSMLTSIDLRKVHAGRLTELDIGRIGERVGLSMDHPLLVHDAPLIDLATIRARCRAVQRRGGLGLVVIDYLQLLSGGPRQRESRQVEVSEISRGLKLMARDLEVPVVALSQLSRGLENRQDKRPMLSDLRESGSLEQDADVVMFLYRDEYYNPESSERGTAELIIAKQRQGPTGTVRLAWDASTASMSSLDFQHNPPPGERSGSAPAPSHTQAAF